MPAPFLAASARPAHGRVICARTAGQVRSLVHRLQTAPDAPPVTVLTGHPGQGLSWLLGDAVARSPAAALVDMREALAQRGPSATVGHARLLLDVLDRKRRTRPAEAALFVVDHADAVVTDHARPVCRCGCGTCGACTAAVDTAFAETAALAAWAAQERRVRVLLCGTACGARPLLRGLGGRAAPVVALRPTDPLDVAAAARLLGTEGEAAVNDTAARALLHFTGLDAHLLSRVAAGFPVNAFGELAPMPGSWIWVLTDAGTAALSPGLPLAEVWRAVMPLVPRLRGPAARERFAGFVVRDWLHDLHRRGVVWVHEGRIGLTRSGLLRDAYSGVGCSLEELDRHLPRLRRALRDFRPVVRVRDRGPHGGPAVVTNPTGVERSS